MLFLSSQRNNHSDVLEPLKIPVYISPCSEKSIFLRSNLKEHTDTFVTKMPSVLLCTKEPATLHLAMHMPGVSQIKQTGQKKYFRFDIIVFFQTYM